MADDTQVMDARSQGITSSQGIDEFQTEYLSRMG